MIYVDCMKIFRDMRWCDDGEKPSNIHKSYVKKVTDCDDSDLVYIPKNGILQVKKEYFKPLVDELKKDFAPMRNPFVLTGTYVRIGEIKKYEVSYTNENFINPNDDSILDESFASKSAIKKTLEKRVSIMKYKGGNSATLWIGNFLKELDWGSISNSDWSNQLKYGVGYDTGGQGGVYLDLRKSSVVFGFLIKFTKEWNAYSNKFPYPKKVLNFLQSCKEVIDNFIEEKNINESVDNDEHFAPNFNINEKSDVYFNCGKLLKDLRWVDENEKFSKEHVNLIQSVTGCSKDDIIVGTRKKLLVKGGYGEDFYGYLAEDVRKNLNNPFLLTGVISRSSLRSIDYYEIDTQNESFNDYDSRDDINESLSPSKVSNLVDKFTTITKSDRGTLAELELGDFLKACDWGKINLSDWKLSSYKPTVTILNIKAANFIFLELKNQIRQWKAYKAGLSYPKMVEEFLRECEKASSKIMKKYNIGKMFEFDSGAPGPSREFIRKFVNEIIEKAIEKYRERL